MSKTFCAQNECRPLLLWRSVLICFFYTKSCNYLYIAGAHQQRQISSVNNMPANSYLRRWVDSSYTHTHTHIDINSAICSSTWLFGRGDGWSCDSYRYYLILQYLLRNNSYSTFADSTLSHKVSMVCLFRILFDKRIQKVKSDVIVTNVIVISYKRALERYTLFIRVT